MTKQELVRLAEKVSHEVIAANMDTINERIHAIFDADEESTTLPLTEAIARGTALSLTLAPEISAAVTAKMLISLGLVEIEDSE